MLSVIFLTSLCECHYAEGHCAKCCYAECHYADCSYAECHYADCSYAECHYAECLGSIIFVLVPIKYQTNLFLIPVHPGSNVINLFCP